MELHPGGLQQYVANVWMNWKENLPMCVSCGCGKPNDAHGDMRNITQDDMVRAAEAAGITPEQAARNIADACSRSGRSQGQQNMSNMGRRTEAER